MSQLKMQLNRPVLVINASYVAINFVAAKRALILVHGGKAHVEVPSGFFVRSGRLTVQLPSVIRLDPSRYNKIPKSTRAVSRKSIILRDRNTCQYCRTKFEAKELTMDHVIPKSRGGSNSWYNMVACCYSCNNRKGARTPDEAGMVLAHKPAPIGIHGKFKLVMDSVDQEAWERFLFV